ncbi:ubiquitin-conjugating enzyme subfamily protein [Cardiosporidium cionae]|uniref:Ubiquitin-conjugating enzyme subfamily protein n=1 Tax=Cardiosporidium cionae TaxID=476202 RepID=A0ABQ7JAA2_9APIC|nr:ubiquitin-conjugating enzyme subfamily protein [Cardiosporidium cionae]|eukprot:KAF8820894.1 ubiquitin-conjugating enzyme subfamily protein [Cardiosporidium cionae]
MHPMMAGYDLHLNNGSTQDFQVSFHGPRNTAYENGVWLVHVTLPDDYPFASPSIGFVNKMLHPNVDEASGSVCLDVINQTWTPLYSLVNVFEVFLPQLLTYPNPTDPLNGDAASLFIHDKKQYDERVKEHVRLYASREEWERRKEKGETDADCDGMFSPLSEFSNVDNTDDIETLDIEDL